MKVPTQITWSQTNSEVTVIFYEKYLKFCWFASARFNEFLPMNIAQKKITLSYKQILFGIEPIEIAVLKEELEHPIIPSLSRWEYIPNVGIQFTLIKAQNNLEWSKPFVNLSQDLYIKLFESSLVDEARMYQNEISGFGIGPQAFFGVVQGYLDSMRRIKEGGYTLKYYIAQFEERRASYNRIPKTKNTGFLNMNIFKDDIQYKKTTLQLSHKDLKLVLLSDLEIQMNQGKFILVRTHGDSMNFESAQFVVSDVMLDATRVYIYNFPVKIIKDGTWLLIKEPMLKFGARDHEPMIRIDNPKDIIFFADQVLFSSEIRNGFNEIVQAEQRERILGIVNAQFPSILLDLNSQKFTFTIVMLPEKSQDFLSGDNLIYIETIPDQWISAQIEQITKVSPQNCFRITLKKTSHNSQLFIESLKQKYDNQAGAVFTIWKEQQTKLKGLVEFILFKNSIPLTASTQFESICRFQLMDSDNLIEKVHKIWTEQQDCIKDSFSKQQKKAIKLKQQQAQSEYKSTSLVASQIQSILSAYHSNAKDLVECKLQENDYSQKLKFNLINQQQEFIEKDKSDHSNAESLDARKVLTKLKEEKRENILENALFFLSQFLQQIASKKEESLGTRKFSNLIIEKKLSLYEFNLNQVLESLSLINFSCDQTILEKINRKKQQQKENRKKREKLNKLFTQLQETPKQESIAFISQDDKSTFQYEEEFPGSLDPIQGEEGEFDENTEREKEIADLVQELDIHPFEEQKNDSVIMDDQQKSSQQQKDITIAKESKQIDVFEENKSIQSLVTVHSRGDYALINQHWKDRLQERFNIDASDQAMKQDILAHIKQLLKQSSDSTQMIQSVKNQNRFLLRDVKNRMQFVLQKQILETNGKTVFFPITVLTSSMKFK